MPDDFSNFGKIKEPFFQTPENVADTKQSPQPKYGTGMRFIITKNKNNSWAEDLHAQEQLNQMDRVYH
jgi:hypothetical protein